MVLVTGGTGLVGAHLLLHLVENGDSVRAIYRNGATIKKTKSLFSLYNKELLFEKLFCLSEKTKPKEKKETERKEKEKVEFSSSESESESG